MTTMTTTTATTATTTTTARAHGTAEHSGARQPRPRIPRQRATAPDSPVAPPTGAPHSASPASNRIPIPSQPPAPSEEWMRRLHRAHSGPLFRLLSRWTGGDRQLAEDLVQETMMRAWRHAASLRGEPESLGPWLQTVARRIAMDSLRARAARPPECDDQPLERMSGPGGDALALVLDRQVVFQGLARLSPEHRTALMYVYILDRTIPQAARDLRVPEGTVKSRVHHALRALRLALDEAAAGS
ncbi:sigma-70 family RNA polymerase sigma factor [Catenulispora sp. NF23]|uniref:sigma-70 family RNA polymerase sigma factor n=1 Tax=Catenulispora pinistramenti TaxID=2705254 RepID=UPI001BA9E39C|nr:sigma-70 family RNA polymerase sigma factor [Catenulispora pinistramenti]MBS2533649.1 sigma-70 family RNA polymerase sigma factor [Catenulispora pinistramenti]